MGGWPTSRPPNLQEKARTVAEAPLIPEQRLKKMLELLALHETLSVRELTNMLCVSHMTVRRDISELERRGLAYGVAGGVRHAQPVGHAPTFDSKQEEDQAEKLAIADYAARWIHDEGTYYLDAGTTTAALLPEIRAHSGLTVVTNDFAIVSHLLADTHINVLHTGGSLDHSNRSSVGPLAEVLLERLSLDVAFISATSWDFRRGVTSTDLSKIGVKRAAMAAASSSVLTAASSKFGKYATYQVAGLDEFDTVVTDDGVPPDSAQRIRESDIDLITCAARTGPHGEAGSTPNL